MYTQRTKSTPPVVLIETEKVSFYKDADGNNIVFDGGVFELNLEK